MSEETGLAVAELHGRAVRLQDEGKPAEAVELYRSCLRHCPEYVPALYNLGMLLLQHGQFESAIPLLAQAYQRQPEDYNLMLGYGIALRQAGHTRAAIEVFCAADRQAPAEPHAMCNLAALHNTLGETALADLFLAEATRRAPEFPNVRWLNAMRLLRQKRYGQGWALFESRFELLGQSAQTTRTALPRWHGEARPFALLREQGHGDCLMMARFVLHPALRPQLAGLEVTAPVVALLRHNFPDLPVVDDVGALTGIEAVLPLMSIPGQLNLEYGDIPAAPYLTAPPAAIEGWAARLPAAAGVPRLGFYWRGSPKHANDAQRSLPFSELARLLTMAGVSWVSLQYEATAEEQAWLAAHGILHLGEELRDFTELAGVLANLDGLIGVDSAPCHLAGAMGIPVWLLLANSPDWRWGVRGSRTRWYRRTLLIRQKRVHEWGAVVARVARGVARLVRNVSSKGDE